MGMYRDGIYVEHPPEDFDARLCERNRMDREALAARAEAEHDRIERALDMSNVLYTESTARVLPFKAPTAPYRSILDDGDKLAPYVP